MTPFEEILKDLGNMFHLTLHVDHSNACSIQIQSGLIVQIQLDEMQENLWIFSKLAELPPGKFREDVLQEALIPNHLPDPRAAIFGYIALTNELALFQKYPIAALDGENLAGIVGAFLEMGRLWQTAIVEGKTAPQTEVK